MPTPYTPVSPVTTYPTAPVEAMLDGLEQVLLTDPTLNGTVNSVTNATLVRSGRGDIHEPDNPAPDELPLIRIRPQGGDQDWGNEAQHKSLVLFRIDMYVPGSNIRDALRIEQAVMSAVFPQDRARRSDVLAMLRGQTDLSDPSTARVEMLYGTMRQAGYESVKLGDETYALRCTSLLRITNFRNS
jgi:hypothetical protein